MKQIKLFGLTIMMGLLFVSKCFGESGASVDAGAMSGFARNWTGYIPILLVFGVFYFLIIRPQNKKRKLLEEMIKNIKSGDQVITHSGIFGSVTDCVLEERYLKMEIAKGVRIKILKSSIALVENYVQSDTSSGS